MPISVLSGNSTKILGTGAYTYDASQNLMVYSNRSLHVDAGEPNSYYISGSTFSDLTGRGINGTLTNSFSGTNPTFSQFNGGYFNFNGFKTTIISNPDQNGNSFIEFNADQLPSGSATSSIITWARCSGNSRTNRYIFSYGTPNNAQARYLGVTTTTGKFLVGGYGPLSELESITSVSLGEWFQLTFVYTGSSILLYVNGVLDNSKTYTLSTVTTNKKARIGRQITVDGGSVANADGYWFGDISEVIVYDRALNPQEIYQDYKVKRYRYGLGEVTRPTDNSEATAPLVTTIAITGKTTTSALSGVQVDSTGNSAITVSGIIWSTLTNPTTTLGTKTTNGTGNITGLSPGVTYYVRAYATNAVGTSYGQQETFTSTPIVLPSVIAITASYTGNSAFATGSVTGLGNATSVSARGFVWNTSPFTQNEASTIITRVTENGSFATVEYGLTISPLTPNNTYYVRAFATNTAITSGTTNTPGTTYSSTQLVFRTYAFATVTITSIPSGSITGTSFVVNITTAGQVITEQGVIWKTDPSDPNISDDLNLRQLGLAGAYSFTINSFVDPGTTYYVYGYVKNSAGIAYSTVQTVTTDNFALVTTDAVDINNIANKSATVSGLLDNMNGSTVTDIGFVWGDADTYPEPLIDLDIDNNTGIYTKTTGIVVGPFNHKITGLSELTNYYVKAYATNAVGTSYGSAQPFTTFGTPVVDILTPTYPTVTPDQYILNGSILSLGGYSPVEVGFEYWITSNPGNKTLIFANLTQTALGSFGKKVTLIPTTNYSVRSYVKYPLGTIYSITTTFQTQAGLPSLTTIPISSLTSTSANSGANVTSDGGSSLIAIGLAYSASPNPTTGDVTVSLGAGAIGIYSGAITGLTPGTTYYVKAYAANGNGITYGNEVTFTTSASTVPVVASTTPVTSIGQNTASSGGNITSDGGASVTARGVVWSTSTNPQLPSTFKTTDGSDIGTFTSTISGLSPKTTYYVRSYATNVNGTTYGTQTSFTTIDVPELTTTVISNLTNNSAQSGGSISTDNGSAIILKGVVWSTSPNPTTLLSTKTSNGSGSGNFTSNLTSLSPSTTYYVKAYATNAAGTGYGNQVILTTSTVPTVSTNTTISNITDNDAQSGGTVASDGGTSVIARGVVWSTSPNPIVTLSTKTTDGTGTGAFISAITGLIGNTTYYVKAYATNANGTSYGSEVIFTTTTIPTLTTSPVINISTTFASSGGDITFAGGGSLTVTAKGVCWSTSPTPTTSNSKTTDGTGTGLFTSNITGLTLNTLYYVRAYATNANGTAYGNQVSFTTLSTILPVITNFARRTTIQSLTNQVAGEPTCASPLGSISAIALFDFDVNVASGGDPITEFGIVSNTSPNPTVNNYKTSLFGTGTQFLARSIGGLAGSQNLWYFRAYSYNGSSYVYSSNTVTFAVPDLIMDNLVFANDGTTWTATAHISNLPSGFTVISKGFRWGVDTSYSNVSIGPYLAGTLNGANAPSFQAVVSGAGLDYSYTLSPVTYTGLYWVQAWVQISDSTTTYKCWSGESTARTIEI